MTMFSPSDAVGMGTNFALPTVSSPSTVVFFVTVSSLLRVKIFSSL